MYDVRTIDELKSKIIISEILGRRISVIHNGRRKMALCPFHSEKTPSFIINDEKGCYHCFGCGEHGDAINFVMKREGLTFKEAVETIAAEVGFDLPKLKLPSEEAKKQNEGRNRIYTINEKTCRFFEEKLFEPKGRQALNYMIKERGLSVANIKKFRIGYAPEEFEVLKEYLLGCGYSNEQLLEAGVVAKSAGGKYYDKFRNRVMFPVLDKKGNIIAFTGRVLNKDEMPKYMNSPETPVYHKSDVLFNIFFARKSIYTQGQGLLVEGNLDALNLYANGIENVVAPMGTAITEQQILELWKICNEIMVCLDGDGAGRKASVRLSRLVLPILSPQKTMRFAFLPDGDDPDSYVKEKGQKAFLENILDYSKTMSLSQFLWDSVYSTLHLKNNEMDAEQRIWLENELKLIVNAIRDTTIKKNFAEFFRKKIFEVTSWKKQKTTNDSYGSTTQIKFAKATFAPNSKEALQELVLGTEKNMMAILIAYPKLMDGIFQNYNTDVINMKYLGKDAKGIMNILTDIYEADKLEDKIFLEKALEEKGFNDYIIHSKMYSNYGEDKALKMLYSLVLEKSIIMLQLELKAMALENSHEERRKELELSLEELQIKKSDFDGEADII